MHKKNKIKQRMKTLNDINTWCYQRASQLSLKGNNQDAQAITEEHLEILQGIKPENILWTSST